jgi:hypothetical protein
VLPEPLHERMRRLELAVAGALAHVTGDDGRGRAEGGQEILECLDLREVGVAAEMKVGEMDDRDRRVAHAQQATRSRITMGERGRVARVASHPEQREGGMPRRLPPSLCSGDS